MRNLSTYEIHSVSGGSVDLFDLGYLFAGYHHFDRNYVLGSGFGIGAILGLINVALPPVGSAPIIGIVSKATWIAVPALVGTAYAFLEYQIGSYAASLVNGS